MFDLAGIENAAYRRQVRLVGPRRADPRLHHRGDAQLRPGHHDHGAGQQRHPVARRAGREGPEPAPAVQKALAEVIAQG